MILQVVAMMLWYNPSFAVKMLKDQNYFDELLLVWFEHLGQFETEHEKERELYGIVALLSLPHGTLPRELSIGAVMREVLQVSKQILDLKRSKKGQLEAEVDKNSPDSGSNQENSNKDEYSDSEEDVKKI